mmetsp:Transcript_37992/g.45897  ORF Transcript_37992/g.45897 Transcript_37992/m.45897 type:complete len:82 (-) Transcript_37992:101-346(-)
MNLSLDKIILVAFITTVTVVSAIFIIQWELAIITSSASSAPTKHDQFLSGYLYELFLSEYRRKLSNEKGRALLEAQMNSYS